MRILLTGGAGYIGSHTAVELLGSGHEVVVFDNLCNSSETVLDRVRRITGKAVSFVRGDIRDAAALDRVFSAQAIDAVVHFAALKAVGESFSLPLDYYDVNVTGSLRLLEAMRRHGVRRLVFSSSATVYGAATPPIDEEAPVRPTSPYGNTKAIVETMLRDLTAQAEPSWHVAILRYFNPVGAHGSGLIGESPHGVPNNLMPFVSQVAVGRRERLRVFGNDYPTPDGTGLRDYLHVVDLALGHLAALEALERWIGNVTFNHGTVTPNSVLEVVRAFEAASGRSIPVEIVPRRPGDIAACWANSSRAEAVLGWKAVHSLARMCEDAWRWQSDNPDGYGGGSLGR